MTVHGRSVDVPASPWGVEWEAESFAEAPVLNAHGDAIRSEFGHGPASSGAESP